MLPNKWSHTRERPRFSDRLGLAQPLIAAGTLTFFSLLLGLPILHMLNSALPLAVAPEGVMAAYNLGSAYNRTADWMTGPFTILIAPSGGLTYSGVLIAAVAFSLLIWIVAMTLVNQWRAQLPVMEEILPTRFLVAVVATLSLVVVLFWLTRLAGPELAEAGAMALALLHFGFGFLIILAWYFALSGTFISWQSLLTSAVVTAFAVTVFVWVLGALAPAPAAQASTFTISAFVLLHLFGLWLCLILGVHGLARQTLALSDWQDLDGFTRGQQVDFGLAVMKTLGQGDNRNRWMSGQTIAQRLGAKHPLTVQILQRLNNFDLVRASQAANRPDHWRLSTESLHAVNLQDLMEAFGATLDPSDGAYGEGPQQAMLNLADQENRVFRTDLASLTRGDRGPALTSDAPAFLSLITDRGIGTDIDAAGAPPPITDRPKAYDRLAALLENDVGTAKTPASQLTDSFPAFGQPPLPNTMARTRTASLEDEETSEEVIEPAEAEGVGVTVDTPEARPAATGTASLLDKKASPTTLKSEEIQAKNDAPPVGRLVATGLTGLVKDLPDNLDRYTVALVSKPKAAT